jgi:hypothetical protein
MFFFSGIWAISAHWGVLRELVPLHLVPAATSFYID